MEFKRQSARFTDSKSNLLEILTKQMKDGTYQVVAYHVPKNGKRQRGCVGSFNDAEAAVKRFQALCAEAEKNKWVRKTRQPKGASAFDTIPKAS
jgi:hypothetical protein